MSLVPRGNETGLLSDRIRDETPRVARLADYARKETSIVPYRAERAYPFAGRIDTWVVTDELMRIIVNEVDRMAIERGSKEYVSQRNKEYIRGQLGTAMIVAGMLRNQFFHEGEEHNFTGNVEVHHAVKVGDRLRTSTKVTPLEGKFFLEGYARTDKGVKIATISDKIQLSY
jgi:hypothetical protein